MNHVAAAQGALRHEADDTTQHLLDYWWQTYRDREPPFWPEGPAEWVAVAVKRRLLDPRRRAQPAQRYQADVEWLHARAPSAASIEAQVELNLLLRRGDIPRHVLLAEMMRGAGHTMEEVASQLEMSLSTLKRELEKWRPALERLGQEKGKA